MDFTMISLDDIGVCVLTAPEDVEYFGVHCELPAELENFVNLSIADAQSTGYVSAGEVMDVVQEADLADDDDDLAYLADSLMLLIAERAGIAYRLTKFHIVLFAVDTELISKDLCARLHIALPAD